MHSVNRSTEKVRLHQTITATKDGEDTVTTESRRREASVRVEATYHFQEGVTESVLSDLDETFRQLRIVQQYGLTLRVQDGETATETNLAATFSAEEIDYALQQVEAVSLTRYQATVLMRASTENFDTMAVTVRLAVESALNTTIREGQVSQSIAAIKQIAGYRVETSLMQNIVPVVLNHCIRPNMVIDQELTAQAQENAAALYKSYRKAKTAEQHLTGLIAEASRNLDYLNSVLDELARAESERDLADIRAELRATGYLRQPRNAKKEKTAQRAPLAFVSSTGYEILVGRSNTQNDELTHRTARRTDIWLHVQKVHGSHVIIRAHDTTPDDQTIAEAASLAVYYSQARGGGKTPVDYTMARFVRKPSGALPGMVLYTDYQTCMAESNEALVERLRVH